MGRKGVRRSNQGGTNDKTLFVCDDEKTMNGISIDYHYHNCDFLQEDGVEIIFGDFYGDAEDIEDKKWWLHLYQEATEDDVDNLKADWIGEILSSKPIEILFCPFCGAELKNQMNLEK